MYSQIPVWEYLSRFIVQETDLVSYFFIIISFLLKHAMFVLHVALGILVDRLWQGTSAKSGGLCDGSLRHPDAEANLSSSEETVFYLTPWGFQKKNSLF